MLLYRSTQTDACFNAAWEECLFRRDDFSEPVLFLYRNEPSILFGRNQNPWAELPVGKALLMGLKVIRRLSGGGTVYHDLGNLNYSLFVPRSAYSPLQCIELVLEALHKTGLPNLDIKDNSSIFSGSHKLSGTAFALNPKVAMVHGCILVHTNLDHLRDALKLDYKRQVQGFFVASNRVPVTSIKNLDPTIGRKQVEDNIVNQMESVFGKATRKRINHGKTAKYQKKFSERAWTYDRSADFTIQDDYSDATLLINVYGSKIQSASARDETGKTIIHQLDETDLIEYDCIKYKLSQNGDSTLSGLLKAFP